MASLLTTFLAAFILAYVLRPVATRLQGIGIHKNLAAIFTIFFGFSVILGLSFLLGSILQTEIPALRDQLPIWLNHSQKTLAPLLDHLPIKLSWEDIQKISQEKMSAHLSNNADNLISTSIETILSSGQNLVTSLLSFVLIMFVMFYLLAQWDTFTKSVKSIIPPRYALEISQICAEIDDLLSQYLRGQMVVITLLALYYAIGLNLLGVAGAVALGVLTGVAILIPYIGFAIACCLAMLSATLQGGSAQIIPVLILYVSGQLLEGFFLTPKLVGERIGLHPVLVIFALMLFGGWFGFFGVLLALPISAIVLVLSRHGLTKYKSSAWYRQ
jgi:predicted PurR-regulated permease PerM